MEGMVGETGEALAPLEPIGIVRVHGEIWKAESVSGNIERGQQVRVRSIKDLKLYVEPINNS